MASNKVSGESSRKAFLIEIRQRIIRISIAVIVIVSICMTMSITTFDFGDHKVLILYPDILHNISSQIISFMKDTLLPKNVSLIQISPGQAFSAQIYVAIVTGVIIALPIVFAEVFAFISPALKHHEKKVIKNILLPSIFLFLAGCFFSYYVVIPYTIEFLYKYGESMTVISFFDVSLFISFVMQMLMVFGFAYQLPLMMWALTTTKFVKSMFWKKNFRYIMIILVIIGAIITPDGSGVSMWFVTGPLIFLYGIGLMLIELKLNRNG
ncbi:MAG: twin-arginine translocase subunit TatC [Thermoproteota archaeon]|nr:twin-arginine translocase subunit TatC [Thermoproteota archaeon]